MAVAEIRIEGFQQVERILNRLPTNIALRYGKRAARAGASLLARRIRANLPRGVPGATFYHRGKQYSAVALHKSVAVRTPRRGPDRNQAVAKVGYVGLANLYGTVVEFGNETRAPNPVVRNSLRTYRVEVAEMMITTAARLLARDLRAGRI